MLCGDISSRGTVKCGSAYMLVSSPAISTEKWVSQGRGVGQMQPTCGYLQTVGRGMGADVTSSLESQSPHSWLWEVNELPTHSSNIKGNSYSSHPSDQKTIKLTSFPPK